MEQSTRLAREHLDKAHKNLSAMYHAVLAALYHIGLAASSHGCAVAAFRRFYIDRGHVPQEYAKFLKRAQQLKKRYAEWILEEAKGFVLQIEEALA